MPHQLSVCSSPSWRERYANPVLKCTQGAGWERLPGPERSIKRQQTLREDHGQIKVFKIAVLCSPTWGKMCLRHLQTHQHFWAPYTRPTGSAQIQTKHYWEGAAKHISSSSLCPPGLATKQGPAWNIGVTGPHTWPKLLPTPREKREHWSKRIWVPCSASSSLGWGLKPQWEAQWQQEGVMQYKDKLHNTPHHTWQLQWLSESCEFGESTAAPETAWDAHGSMLSVVQHIVPT